MKIETETKIETEVTVKTTVSQKFLAHVRFDEMILPSGKFFEMVLQAALAEKEVSEHFGFKVVLSRYLAPDKVCLRLNGEVVALITEK